MVSKTKQISHIFTFQAQGLKSPPSVELSSAVIYHRVPSVAIKLIIMRYFAVQK